MHVADVNGVLARPFVVHLGLRTDQFAHLHEYPVVDPFEGAFQAQVGTHDKVLVHLRGIEVEVADDHVRSDHVFAR